MLSALLAASLIPLPRRGTQKQAVRPAGVPGRAQPEETIRAFSFAF